MNKRFGLCFGVLVSVLAGCDAREEPSSGAASATVVEPGFSARSPLGSVPVPLLAPPPASSAHAGGRIDASELGRLSRELSEPDGSFFSDNIVSNETSYLQVASLLRERAVKGGAYIGVGPEQNFTYIAQVKPKLAFIVDIRRQNMILHLLYRAIFEEASSRAHFLSLLLGRAYEAKGDPGGKGGIEAVIAHVEKNAPDEGELVKSHARLLERIEGEVKLDAEDKKTLELLHRGFFKSQLEVHFELHESSGRHYPTLRELLVAKEPGGGASGFLADEGSFRFVQEMEREGRIIPVVGDFAGDRAMPGVAAAIRDKGLRVSAFYVSNVEQYLLEPKVWAKWVRNVKAMPVDEGSLFIRAYLDQGRHHRLQMEGHRTATLLQRVVDFEERKEPYRSFWALVNDRVVEAPGGVD